MFTSRSISWLLCFGALTSSAAAQVTQVDEIQTFTIVNRTKKNFTIVSLQPSDGKLAALLIAESAKAKVLGQKPVVELYADWCDACRDLRASLDDPLMMEAFANTYIIRLDTDAWGGILDAEGFSSRVVPVFFTINDKGKPDGRTITGGAWGANTPTNMAPPLSAYFRE